MKRGTDRCILSSQLFPPDRLFYTHRGYRKYQYVSVLLLCCYFSKRALLSILPSAIRICGFLYVLLAAKLVISFTQVTLLFLLKVLLRLVTTLATLRLEIGTRRQEDNGNQISTSLYNIPFVHTHTRGFFLLCTKCIVLLQLGRVR